MIFRSPSIPIPIKVSGFVGETSGLLLFAPALEIILGYFSAILLYVYYRLHLPSEAQRQMIEWIYGCA